MIYQSKYGKIYYQQKGNENAPAIIFIHGVGMDHKTFDEQVDELKNEFRLLVWDLPGHGNSTLQNYNKRFTELSAHCMNELMDAIGIEKAFFVGQSLGSMIVQHFQILHPEKIRASIHVPGIELKSHVGSWSKRTVPFMMAVLNLIPAKTFYKSFGKHRAVKKEVQRYLSETMAKTGKKLALQITEDMVYDLIDSSPVPEQSPMLITYGQKDLFFIKKAAKNWHRQKPNSKCMEIKNANHIANQDNPVAFNKAVTELLNQNLNN